jgi:hypothetical protein
MLATKNGHRLEDEHAGPGESDPAELVWEAVNAWVWCSTCGKFRIERFVTGDHEALGTGFTWPERYRVLRHTPQWYFEFAPSQENLDAAKKVCEGLAI